MTSHLLLATISSSRPHVAKRDFRETKKRMQFLFLFLATLKSLFKAIGSFIGSIVRRFNP